MPKGLLGAPGFGLLEKGLLEVGADDANGDGVVDLDFAKGFGAAAGDGSLFGLPVPLSEEECFARLPRLLFKELSPRPRPRGCSALCCPRSSRFAAFSIRSRSKAFGVASVCFFFK